MANRVTDSEVRTLLGAESSLEVAPYVATANLLVTEELGSAGLTTDRLTQIELYLAAHFAALTPNAPQANMTQGESGEDRIRLGGQFGMGFDQTRFGQQAMAMDTSGNLRRLQKPKASFSVFGPEYTPTNTSVLDP